MNNEYEKDNSTKQPLIDGMTPTIKEQYLDRDKLMRFLPKGSRRTVTDELMKKIKSIEEDAGILQEYAEEQILTHIGVLKEVKCSVGEYIDAVKFVSLTNSGMSNSKAYEIVFPERVKKIMDRTGEMNTSWSTQYNQNAIVTKLRVAMYVPVQITHKPIEAHAINTLFALSRGESPVEGMRVSANVVKDSAIGLLNYFKEEKDKGTTINIGVGESDEALKVKKQMADSIEKMIELQREAFQKGIPVEDIQKMYIDVEVSEGGDEDAYC